MDDSGDQTVARKCTCEQLRLGSTDGGPNRLLAGFGDDRKRSSVLGRYNYRACPTLNERRSDLREGLRGSASLSCSGSGKRKEQAVCLNRFTENQ
jgi:hypothetical protein